MSGCPSRRTRTLKEPPAERKPTSLQALGFFPFQLNPHYVNAKPAGFHGETRNERFHEFLLLNPTSQVVVTGRNRLHLENNKLLLHGERPAILFMLDADDGSVSMISLEANSDVSWLI
jgi:dipeptidase E